MREPINPFEVPEPVINYLSPSTPGERELIEDAWTGFTLRPKIIYAGIDRYRPILANPKHIIEYLATHLKPESPRGLRDRFIVGFLFWTGVRVKELVLSRKKDLDLESRKYNVPSLVRRRIEYVRIPLSHVPDAEIELWRKYLAMTNHEYLVDVKTRQIERAVKRLLGKEYTPRSLRHALGLWLAALDYDVDTVLRFVNEPYRMIYYAVSEWDLEELAEFQ